MKWPYHYIVKHLTCRTDTEIACQVYRVMYFIIPLINAKAFLPVIMRFFFFLAMILSLSLTSNALPIFFKMIFKNEQVRTTGNVRNYHEQVTFQAPSSNIYKTAPHTKLDKDFTLDFFESSLFSDTEV
jgi:hypothetical protein